MDLLSPTPSHPALIKISPEHGIMTLGVELPLDNDWSSHGRTAAVRTGRPGGVPELDGHHKHVQLADQLGYAALWLRDVPLWDPSFGDAGQVFEPISYLGYLAGITHTILLGTAGIVLPLRHPLHLAKATATIDRLSNGRLLLGVASGDRPVEYPAFGVDFPSRGQAVRDGIRILRQAWVTANSGAEGVQILPQPAHDKIPILMTGRGQQNPAWIATNLEGCFTYHRPPQEMRLVVEEWRQSCGEAYRPLLTTMIVDLDEDPKSEIRPFRFGGRLGHRALLRYLLSLQEAGVAHVALNFRPSERPVKEVLVEIAEHVLPYFSTTTGN